MADSNEGWLDETGEFYADETADPPSRDTTQTAQPTRRKRNRVASGPSGRGVSGVVAGLAQRTEQQRTQYPDGRYGETAITVCSFRLEGFDQSGNRAQSVPVEMRGAAFTGSLVNGDRVAASGEFEGGVLYCDQVVHLDSGARFALVEQSAARQRRNPIVRIGIALFVAFVVGFIALCFATVFGGIFGIKIPGLPTGFDPGSGPSASSTAPVTMPNVIGESNVNAAQILNKAGIEYLVEYVPAPSSQFGKVIRTSPSAGRTVTPGATVRVYFGEN